MKIVHLCLASFYIDNYSYQENLLPKYHKRMGHDVYIVSSLQTFDENGKPTYLKKPSNYINEHGIPVYRIDYGKSKTSKRLRKYDSEDLFLNKLNPDIIFVHGVQFYDMKKVIKHLKLNPNVKCYIDNHADLSNSATNFMSKNILHKIIWRRIAQKSLQYVDKFYGVLPSRVDFLENIYKIPSDKTELLIMGVDDDQIDRVNKLNFKELRGKYNIHPNDFVIIFGGKFDKAKEEVFLLIDYFKKRNYPNIKLIIFGSIIPEFQKRFYTDIEDYNNIQYLGWQDLIGAYELFHISDLAVFPGRHSVYWEQVVGQGIPAVFKKWPGTKEHLDFNGNAFFIENLNDNLFDVLDNIINDKNVYYKMKKQAKIAKEGFLYSNIAIRSIDE